MADYSNGLVAGEVVEVVHDGAAQMAEHEPEDGLENFLGCRRHAGRVSHAGTESRARIPQFALPRSTAASLPAVALSCVISFVLAQAPTLPKYSQAVLGWGHLSV